MSWRHFRALDRSVAWVPDDAAPRHDAPWLRSSGDQCGTYLSPHVLYLRLTTVVHLNYRKLLNPRNHLMQTQTLANSIKIRSQIFVPHPLAFQIILPCSKFNLLKYLAIIGCFPCNPNEPRFGNIRKSSEFCFHQPKLQAYYLEALGIQMHFYIQIISEQKNLPPKLPHKSADLLAAQFHHPLLNYTLVCANIVGLCSFLPAS